MFGAAPATIARHSKIAPFDIAQTAQLLEECPIVRIAAGLTKCGCGIGRMEIGDAIDPSPKFAPAIRRKLNLLNRLGRKSIPESVHVDIHKSANL